MRGHEAPIGLDHDGSALLVIPLRVDYDVLTPCVDDDVPTPCVDDDVPTSCVDGDVALRVRTGTKPLRP